MPLISVILPTYNRQQFLPEAIQSILDQTENNFELIVADDGSTDATESIVSNFIQHDPRVIYLPLPHTGRSYARNRALEISRGEFIAFQDSDDIALPNRLAVQMNTMKNQPHSGMVICSSLYIDSQGKERGEHYILQPTDDLYRAILLINYRAVGPMTAMVQRKVIEQIGFFDEKLDRFEDLDFYLRVAQCFPTCTLPEPLIKARLHDENAMPSQQPVEVLRNLDHFSAKVIANRDARISLKFAKKGLARLYLVYANETSKYFPFRDFLPFYRRALSLSPDLKQIAWFLLATLGLTHLPDQLLPKKTQNR